MELLMYPMKTLRITQGYGFTVDGVDGTHTFSHAGQHALDQGGRDGGVDPVYAPASCVVKRITPSYNIVYFETLEKVYCADGTKDYMSWRFMHISDLNLRKLGIRVGKVFKQGEICYYEGNKGMGSTGTHLHMEVAKGKYTGTGSFNLNGHNSINNPVFAHKVMFVGTDVNIVKGVYPWKRVTAADYLAAGSSSTIAPSAPTVTPSTGSNTAAGIVTVGETVNLKNQKLYASSTGSAGYMKTNAVYYIYDGKCVNGRYRVTNNGARVNAGFQYVSGWVDASDINGGTSSSSGTTSSSTTGNVGLVAGTQVTLNGKLYASSSSTFGFTKSNFNCFIFDGKILSGRYRVCLLSSYVNKSAAYVAGYVDPNEITIVK